MVQSSQMPALIEQLRLDPSLPERLPSQEGAMVREALRGKSVHEIASACQTSEAAVWRVLGSAAREAAGAEVHPVEIGGFGSDTDPGISGGYGATGFGDLEAGPDSPDLPEATATLSADTDSDAPRPSQAEGEEEDEERPSDGGALTDEVPRPSQAEGDEETVDEALRRQDEQRRQG
ncbi:MAG TPA: hypothetical protein PKD53_07410 [Chloroflexaceae bacterium]|nr:hypothetical protein [Chloroflexaceae bacterium]